MSLAWKNCHESCHDSGDKDMPVITMMTVAMATRMVLKVHSSYVLSVLLWLNDFNDFFTMHSSVLLHSVSIAFFIFSETPLYAWSVIFLLYTKMRHSSCLSVSVQKVNRSRTIVLLLLGSIAESDSTYCGWCYRSVVCRTVCMCVCVYVYVSSVTLVQPPAKAVRCGFRGPCVLSL